MRFRIELNDFYNGGARREFGEELTRKYYKEDREMGFEAAIEYAPDFDRVSGQSIIHTNLLFYINHIHLSRTFPLRNLLD